MREYLELVGGVKHLLWMLLTSRHGIFLVFLPKLIRDDHNNLNFFDALSILKDESLKPVYNYILKNDAVNSFKIFIDCSRNIYSKSSDAVLRLYGETPNPLVKAFKITGADGAIFQHIVNENNRQHYIDDLFYHLFSCPSNRDDDIAITILELLLKKNGSFSAFVFISIILSKAHSYENRYVFNHFFPLYLCSPAKLSLEQYTIQYYLELNQLSIQELIQETPDIHKHKVIDSFLF